MVYQLSSFPFIRTLPFVYAFRLHTFNTTVLRQRKNQNPLSFGGKGIGSPPFPSGLVDNPRLSENFQKLINHSFEMV
jgi:hypothetical protein